MKKAPEPIPEPEPGGWMIKTGQRPEKIEKGQKTAEEVKVKIVQTQPNLPETTER